MCADPSSSEFPYEVVRSARRRSVGIVVKADGSVCVRVPARFPEGRIEELVRAKSSWIQRKRKQARARQAGLDTRVYRNGEAFPFLGESLEFRIDEKLSPDTCLRDNDRLRAGMPAMADDGESGLYFANLVGAWYRDEARLHFRARVAELSGRVGVEPALVDIKSYRTRWGSCHRDGRIYFNWRLVMAPPFVVDYVVIHELCHLIRADHSRRFWSHVARFCPDFKVARRWLKEHGHRLDV